MILRLAGTGLREDQQPVAQVELGNLGKDAVLELDRPEDRIPGEQHLGLAQEHKALLRQCVVEPGKYPALGLRLEVHQAVAADQQVHA